MAELLAGQHKPISEHGREHVVAQNPSYGYLTMIGEREADVPINIWNSLNGCRNIDFMYKMECTPGCFQHFPRLKSGRKLPQVCLLPKRLCMAFYLL